MVPMCNIKLISLLVTINGHVKRVELELGFRYDRLCIAWVLETDHDGYGIMCITVSLARDH